MRDPLDHLAKVVDGSDEMVLFKLGMYMTYLLNSPEQISRVLHENPEGYDRSAFLTELLPLIGNEMRPWQPWCIPSWVMQSKN